MASPRVEEAYRARIEAGDESRLTMYVAVNQTSGTYAVLERSEHYGRTDHETTTLAKIRTDAKDGSPEALMDLQAQLLVLYTNRVLRAAELRVAPF